MVNSSCFHSTLLVVLCFGATLLHGVSSQCVPFPEIDEANYDRNYSSINDVDRRPLGFLRATVLFNNASANPCFSMDNLNGRSVEVMFETVPRMMLCFRDQAGQRRCQEDRFHNCGGASANTMQYTFFCDVSEGCSESDVNFWVRITRGPPQVEDPEGMWCQWRDNNYPQSLATLPPSFTPAPTLPSDVGGSANVAVSHFLFMSLLTFTMAYVLKL